MCEYRYSTTWKASPYLGTRAGGFYSWMEVGGAHGSGTGQYLPGGAGSLRAAMERQVKLCKNDTVLPKGAVY